MGTSIITKKRLAAILLLVITVTVSTIAIMGYNKTADTLNKVLIRADTISTFSGRTAVWKNGIEIGLKYNPFTGVGRQKSIEINNTTYQNTLTHFHSTYIQILAMFGIIGLTLFIYLIFLTIIKVCTAQMPRQFRATILATITTFMVISIFESVTRFSIGYADTIGAIFYFTIPLLIANNEQIFVKSKSVKTHRKLSSGRRAKE
jgi:O-antigen ligase